MPPRAEYAKLRLQHAFIHAQQEQGLPSVNAVFQEAQFDSLGPNSSRVQQLLRQMGVLEAQLFAFRV
jgi:hypothetical protein